MFYFVLISCVLACVASAQNAFCPVANGNVPNPASEGCVTYFRCINHLPVLLRCPRGEQFHFARGRCMKGRDVNCTAQLERFVAKESSPFNFDDDKTREAFLSRFRYDGTLPELKRTVQSQNEVRPHDLSVSVPREGMVSHQHVLPNGTVLTHSHSTPLVYSVRNGQVVARVLPHNHPESSNIQITDQTVIPRDHKIPVPKEARIVHQHVLPNGQVVTHKHLVPLAYYVRNGKIVARVRPHSYTQNIGGDQQKVNLQDRPVSVPKQARVVHQHVLPNGQVVTHTHLVPLTYYVRNGKIVARVRPHAYTQKTNIGSDQQKVNLQDRPVSVPKQARVIHQHVLPNGTVVTHTHLVPLKYVVRNGKVIARVLSHFHDQSPNSRSVRQSVIPEDLPVPVPQQAVVRHQHLLPNGTVTTHSHSVPLVYFVRNGNVFARGLSHSHTSPSLRGQPGRFTPMTSYYNPSASTTLPYPNVLASPPTTTPLGRWWNANIRNNAPYVGSSLYPYRVPIQQVPRLIDNIDIYSKDRRRRLG